jgi:ABC-2 type transport system permease protein
VSRGPRGILGRRLAGGRFWEQRSRGRRLGGGRFWALALKELRQIRRDRRLTISLIVPPLLQILLFGFALDADVRDLRLGIADESRTAESRELISVITENRTFRLAGSYPTAAALERALGAGHLDVGVVVPSDFARLRARGRPATVQVLLNAVNANTAQIAQGYVEGAVGWLNRRVEAPRAPANAADAALAPAAAATPGAVVAPGVAATLAADARDAPALAASRDRAARVEVRTAFLYNPGLVTAWFTVSGVFGTLIILNGSLVSAGTMIREKERGTVEQLLMTPASALEVIAAKILPLFVLLMGMAGLALVVARLVFHVPFRGSLLLVLAACAGCVLTGIGIGMFISTLARSANQTLLIGFFVNPPLAALSGAFTPIEAMPKWIQPWTVLNPIAHFAAIARSVLVKGAGLEVVYPHLLALIVFGSLLVGVSAWRFRRQLG